MFDLSRAELKRMNLFYKAVAVANKIATIATRAAKKGIKIRWFEYSSQSRGGESYLKPVNSVELSSLKVGRYNALEYLGLSSADKMSLVYNAPLEESGPPVLFSAESLFDFSNSIPWKNNMLITAPHHGSEANAVVYEKLEDYEENNEDINPVWVRSDSENHHRPCEEYINASGNRFCTVCNNPPRNKQPVKLKVKKGKWVPEGNTNKCHCK